MNIVRSKTLVTALLLSGLMGCAHKPSCSTVAPVPSVSGFAGNCDCSPVGNLPRAPIRPAPVPATPPGFGVQPGTPAPPALPGDHATPKIPNDTQGNYPPADPKLRPEPPADVQPRIGDIRDPKAILKPPQVGESQTPRDPRLDADVLPVDIPQFGHARKQVASGQKPFPDGFDWLRNKGYRTVLFIRAPGEDDSAARRQVTDRGLRYLSLEVSPTTLNRDIIDAFNNAVTSADNQPLFVYDRDSSLLGGLWYLHFRLQEGLDHEKAAVKAGVLGLNVDADAGAHKDMWLAVQRYLQMSKTMSRPLVKIHTATWTRVR